MRNHSAGTGIRQSGLPARWMSGLLCAGALTFLTAVGVADQRTLDTPEAIVTALIEALRQDDARLLETLFGADAAELLESGDPVDDQLARQRFLDAIEVEHELVPADNGFLLEVGADRWPFPIPIVGSNGQWRFDTAAGIDEIVYRRIGRNELGAIETSLGLVAAQQEYASESRDGAPSGVYARQVVSDPGRRNGLYWEPAEGERASPIGPFLAVASSEGYRPGSEGATPYHGYLYRLLTAQGPAAPGGAENYLVDGMLAGGFAFIAYPVDYQSSGVMTFLVSQAGIVFQKDLGPDTRQLAEAVEAFDPDDTWMKVD